MCGLRLPYWTFVQEHTNYDIKDTRQKDKELACVTD